jgi:hypothetical protein
VNERPCRLAHAGSVGVELHGATLAVEVTNVELLDGWAATIEVASEREPVVLRLLLCPSPDVHGRSVLHEQIALPAPVAAVRVVTADGERVFDLMEVSISEPVFGPRPGLFRGMGQAWSRTVDAIGSILPAGRGRRSVSTMASDDLGDTLRSADNAAESEPPLPPIGNIALPDAAAGEDVAEPAPDLAADYSTAAQPPSTPPPTPTADAGDVAPDQPLAESDKPFFARLDAPDKFVVGADVEVSIGIAASPDPNVDGSAMHRPASLGDTFVLTVQLVADGFQTAGGAPWRYDLAVTPDQPYPWAAVDLVADPIDDDLQIRRLRTIYMAAGQVIGIAERPVAVVSAAAVSAPTPAEIGFARRAAMSIPVSRVPADLSMVILHDPDGPRGRLLWAFASPHAGVPVPDHDLTTDIGDSPADFGKNLRAEVEEAEATPGQPVLWETVRGLGDRIAGKIPSQAWELLSAVAAQVPQHRPTVLLLSQEPYVPWELAVMPQPLDPDLPDFLGAQTVVGRWVFSQAKPKMPPPETLAATAVAVVYGEYRGSRLAELAEAKVERQTLEATYQATPVRATLTAVRALLRGDPPGQVLHFAIHGRFDAAGGGLLMEDAASLTADAVGGFDLTAAPLVFLNACQVGSAAQSLGDYAGMADAFLRAGASAVIAPLWSVRDSVAKDIAVRFYAGALGAGEPPAELLRRERLAFGTQGPASTATPMAYLFYGHPSFAVTKG